MNTKTAKLGWARRLVCMALSLALALSLCTVSAFAGQATNLEWYNFRNSAENNGVTNRATPTTLEETNLKWGVKYGTGWAAAPTPPLLLDGYLYIGVGNKILKLDKATGEKVAESDAMVANVGYAMNPILYADGVLFVQVGNGMIQAVDYETLQCLWSTEKIGGQTLCPISYVKIGDTGYIYTGTWNSEKRDGAYICVTTDDTGVVDGKKPTLWRFVPSGDASSLKNLTFTGTPVQSDSKLSEETENVKRGFYWAGSYANAKYIAVGSDDGTSEGDYTANACFYTLDPLTGAVIDRISGIKGDIRSTVVYDNGYLYFNTKGGVLYQVPVDTEGKLGTAKSCDLGGMATASPLVYKGKIYLGVAGQGGQFDPDGGHRFAVISSATMTELYSLPIKGYPQAAALLSTAYEGIDFNNDGKADGRVYIYFTYNANPGGIYYTYDTPDQTEAATASQELFIPSSEKQQYCISTICADTEGTLYYKNDSCYLMAVERNSAWLDELTVEGAKTWSKTFAPGTTDYEVVMPSGTSAARITLKAPAGTSVTVNGDPYTTQGNTVSLDANGQATVSIVTQASAGAQRTYTLRIRTESTESALGGLLVNDSNTYGSALTMNPSFAADTTTYTVDVTGLNQRFYNIWPDAADKNSTIKVYAEDNVDEAYTEKDGTIAVTASNQGHDRYAVYPADAGKTTKVRVEVTSEDGTSIRSYTVLLLVKTAPVEVVADTTCQNAEIVLDEATVGILQSSLQSAMQQDAALRAKVEDAMLAGKTITIKVLMKELTQADREQQQAIKSVQQLAGENGMTVAGYFDISLAVQADGETLGTLPRTDGKIAVSLKLTDNMPNKNVAIYRVHNGSAEALATTVKDGYAQAETDLFSVYALAYQKADKPTTPSAPGESATTTAPSTGDQTNIWLWSALLGGLTLAGITLIVYHKRREK